MKCILSFVIIFIFKTTPLYAQSEVLTIYKNDGNTLNYSLDEYPKISFYDKDLKVTTNKV